MVIFRNGTLLKKRIAILSAIFLILLALAGAWFLDPYGFRMAPGVSVGSMDISGLGLLSAVRSLDKTLEETLYVQPLTVTLPAQTLSFTPEDTQPKVNTWKAAWDAYGIGRWLDTGDSRLALADYLSVNEDAIRSSLAAYAAAQDTALRESAWTLEGDAPALGTGEFDPHAPCQTLSVTLGCPETYLDTEAAWNAVLQTLCNAPAACAEDAYALTLDKVTVALPEPVDVAAISREVSLAPVSDSLSFQTYEPVAGSYGYQFDADQLSRLLAGAAYGETVTVSMEYVTPEVLGDQVYFRDLLGSCETKHTNNENRNTNLRLLCQALDGHILQPGEEFSYNGVVGERTAEKGYKPAPAYSGNRLVDSIGGGVCQGSTTLYNCVLLADLEVVFRACHGASVGYVPRGLDAAVNYLTTDFKFRNNWNFPIMIRAEVSDGYVKMQIMGTDEKDYYVKMESRSGEDDIAIYARSYKCKYSKETDELISREIEAYSTYYKDIG